jgi:hypothetical protein
LSLDRKDVRFKLAPEMHQALAVLAECAQADLGEFVEGIVSREVARRVHEASVIANHCAGLGIAGKTREDARSGGRS